MNLALGAQFGSFTVLRKSASKRKQGPRYRCQCKCGRVRFIKASKLRKGEATSCDRCEEQLCKDDSSNQGETWKPSN